MSIANLGSKIILVFSWSYLVSLVSLVFLHFIIQVSKQIRLALIVVPVDCTHLFVLMVKVFICTIGFDLFEASWLRISLLYNWHLDPLVFNVIPLYWLEEIMLLNLHEAKPTLTVWLDKATNKALGLGWNLWFAHGVRSWDRSSSCHVWHLWVSQVYRATSGANQLRWRILILVWKCESTGLNPLSLLFVRCFDRECRLAS